MRRRQDKVAAAINPGGFFLRIAAPKQKHDRIGPIIDGAHHGIGKFFPAAALMTGRPCHFDRQHAVEQQYALFRPGLQKAMPWPWQAKIAFQFLENIDQ